MKQKDSNETQQGTHATGPRLDNFAVSQCLIHHADDIELHDATVMVKIRQVLYLQYFVYYADNTQRNDVNCEAEVPDVLRRLLKALIGVKAKFKPYMRPNIGPQRSISVCRGKHAGHEPWKP